jgi:hypothetical protein
VEVGKVIPKFLKEERSLPWIFLIMVIVVGIQKFSQGTDHCNNYIIFKTSFFHLIHYKDLYLRYPDEYDDLFLYTPTFALLMSPLACLPMFVQVILWCGVIGFFGYTAIRMLPLDDSRKKIWLMWFIFFEFITAMQNMQTAGIVASCVIIGFVYLERDNVFKAALFISLAAFIKIYAIAAAILFLMYPKRLKFIISMMFWGLILACLPLLVVSLKQLTFLYQSWYNLTTNIHQSEQVVSQSANILIPLSVMTWLKAWFHLSLPIIAVQITGTLILCASFLRYRFYENPNFRLLLLASLLIWAMIFNHIAESPSYIVAVFGAGIWFVNVEKNRLTISLAVLAFVFTTLESTDIFPKYIREHFFDPYVIKAVPCIFIWFYIQYMVLFKKFGGTSGMTSISV